MLLDDLETAFEFVSSSPPLLNTAYVSRSTGETFYRSDLADEDDLPEDVEENPDYVEVPHRNDLDLGQRLVWDFVEREVPQHSERVRGFFRRRGAYGRFRDFLDAHHLLTSWDTFEAVRTRQALLEWAAAVGLAIDDTQDPTELRDLRIWQDAQFTVDHTDECLVPGYLIVRMSGGPRSLGELGPEQSHSLASLLPRTARAIEQVTAAERVYCLSFCEIDRALHFHLFPRSRALLEAYLTATGASPGPVNGPVLFEWARTHIMTGAPPVPGLPSVDFVCGRLRALLGEG